MRRRIPWFSFGRGATASGVRLTAGGAFFVLGTILIGLAAIDADINLLLLIFGFCIGGLAVNAVHGWRTLRAIAIERIAPGSAVAGQPFTIRYILTNGRRWGTAKCLLIQDVLERPAPLPIPEAFVPALRPGEAVTVTVPAISASRGRIAFRDLKVSTRFPFHLFAKWVRHRREHETIVFPALGRLQAPVMQAATAADSSIGAGAMGHVRGDEEFYGIREYRAGDNPRRIHWRRSARTGQLMIREMAQASGRQLWCVLDTRIEQEDVEQRRKLELAISAAATVVCDALENGTRVGLICNGEPFVALPPNGGRAHRPLLLRELAIRGANTDDDLNSHIAGLTWPARWRGPCLLFGSAATEDLRAAARTLSLTLGITTTYVPGNQAFENLFSPAPNREPAASEPLGGKVVGTGLN